MNFSGKKLQKVAHFVKKHEKYHPFGQNLHLLEQTTMFWHFHELYQQEVAKSASFREKARETHRFGQNYATFSNKLPCFGAFRWTFEGKGWEKWFISWKSTKNHGFGQNCATFWTTLPCLWRFDELFSKKLQKLPHFVKKHEKSSIWPKFCNLSNKLPCLCISINFSGKSCKKCVISWKSTKNHRFGQNFASFGANYHVFGIFDELFSKKLQKVPHFVKKHEKSSILAKTMQLFGQTTMSLHFDQLFRKKCKKCLISTRRTRIHRFGQNWQLFEETTMSWHFHELFRKKLQKVPHSVEKHENSWIWSKLWQLFVTTLPCFDASMNFSAKGCRKWINSWKSTRNHRYGQLFATFPTNYHVFAFRWTFQKKVAKSASFREEKDEKPSIWPELCNFSSKLPCLGIVDEIFRKKLKKVPYFVKKSTRNHRFGQNLATFRANYHVLALSWPCFQKEVYGKKLQKLPHFVRKHEKLNPFGTKTMQLFPDKLPCFGWTLWQKVAKTASFREKARKLMDLAETMQLFRTNYHVLVFRWTVATFCEKFAKSCSIREKARKIIDLAKTVQVSEQTAMSLHFDELFRKKLQKMPHFVKKHEKSSIWPKLCNFSNKLPCVCISINFSGKSCRKSTFQEKVAESASFCEKARKIIDLAKSLELLEQTTMSLHFDQLFRKKLQKVRHFVKKDEKSSILPNLWNFSNKLQKFFGTFRTNYHVFAFRSTFQKKMQKVPHFDKKNENSSIWPELATFRGNYDVLAFSWTFQKEVAKSASLRGKAREFIDLAKMVYDTFCNKLPCFGVSMNFSAKGCRKWINSWKSTKNHRFGQIFDTFCNKLPCFGVSMNFSAKGCRKWINSWKSTRNHRSGQNFATFQTNYHVFAFRWTFQKKVAKSASFREENEKPSIWPELATFRANYHVLALSWTFQKEVAKSALFREKAREIIHFTKTCNFSRKLPCLDELYGKKLQKLPHFVKKHENSWIWPKLCNFFEQTTMFWCFDELLKKSLQKVAQFVKKHEKSSIWPKLCKFPNKPPCLCISMNFSGKSCKKCLISWKSTKNHRFGQNFATYRTNYHVFAFRWTFQVKVAKSASFREKARKTINLAKTFHFSKKQPCLGIFLNSWARNCKNCLIPWKTTRIHRFGQNYATFSNKLPCFGASVNFSAKVCRKWLNSWKSTKNHRFGQNFATFQTNYHVFAFRWTFQEKVATSASFREKAWETIDLAKTFDFSKKLPFLGIFLNFWARSWKEKHENSSIWPKLWHFL